MIDSSTLAGFSVAAMVFTAFMHSWVGERRIVMPLLTLDERLVRAPLPRWIIRYAWHLLSAFMVVSALQVWSARAAAIPADQFTLLIQGALWLGAGIATLIGSRGKHIGWPPIILAGACALLPLA